MHKMCFTREMVALTMHLSVFLALEFDHTFILAVATNVKLAPATNSLNVVRYEVRRRYSRFMYAVNRFRSLVMRIVNAAFDKRSE